ncbi:hypothetical protein CLU79DRAFT_737570 [Phycomyces nitens]|nr:hypothetical protein CLU79DRAFT_737570 [Phycomyces nitens]
MHNFLTLSSLGEQKWLESSKNILLGFHMDWVLFRYRKAGGQTISVYPFDQGTGGINMLKERIAVNEIQFAMLLYDRHLITLVYVPRHVSDTQKAQAAVHGHTLSKIPAAKGLLLTVNQTNELSEPKLRLYIKRHSLDLMSPSSSNSSISLPRTPPLSPHLNATVKSHSFNNLQDFQKRPLSKRAVGNSHFSASILNPKKEASLMSRKELKPPKVQTKPLGGRMQPKQKARQAQPKEKPVEPIEVESVPEVQIVPKEEKEIEKTVLSGELTVLTEDSRLWRRRYFEITNKRFLLFPEWQGTTPCSVFDLEGITHCTTDFEERLMPHSFEVCADGQVFQVYADSDEFAAKIMAALIKS